MSSFKPGQAPSELSNAIILCGALVIVLIAMSQLSPYFLTAGNLIKSTRFMAEIGLLSLGMALVVIGGGIDLSVGSMLALNAIVTGILVSLGLPQFVVIGAVLVFGCGLGAFNGFMVTRVGLPPIIATLATLAIYRGIALGISGGASYPIPDSFGWLGRGALWGLPTQFIILVVAFAVIFFVMQKTPFGSRLYATGDSEEVARFSGIATGQVLARTYMLSGLFAAAAALIFVSRVSSAKADAGMSYELDAITIVVLASIPLAGGRGSIGLLAVSLATVGLVRNGMSLAFIQSDMQAIVIGLLLLGAVMMNRLLSLGAFWLSMLRAPDAP